MATKRRTPAGVEVVLCRVETNTIQAAIKDRKLSQEETARRAGMTARQLSRIIKQNHCPSLERGVALSVVLKRPMFSLGPTRRPALFTLVVKERDARV